MKSTASSRHSYWLAELPMQVLLAGLSALLLFWPIIQIAGGNGVFSWAIYLLVIWLGMILVLAAIARSIALQQAPPTVDQPPPAAGGQTGGAA